MSLATVKYKLAPYGQALVGKGAYSNVYKATEEGTSKQVAIKKSRVSKRVERPILRHEARVLQLLQGHATIPAVYGYGQLDHFEYMAMELLGPSVAKQQKDGAGVAVETVIRLIDQVLAALQHIHSFGIVHRDIKPDNLLCSLDDASTIKIIDFGISKPFSCDQPTKYDPFKEGRHIIGSLYWASLNSHNGIDLAPRDDLESLAYIALFLLRGNLPWKPRPRLESQVLGQEIVRLMKSECSGPALSTGFHDEFGDMLTYSRSLEFSQIPDYTKLRSSFSGLAKKIGYSLTGSLDWTPCYVETNNPLLAEPEIPPGIPDEDGDDDSDDTLGEDSYWGLDIDIWERQGERDKNLTFPASQGVELDGYIPLIIEVQEHSPA